MGRDSVFWCVYRVVVRDEKLFIDRSVLGRCIEVAARNKVLLHFLRVLGIRGRVRFREEAKYRRFVRNLHVVAEALDGLDHVFVKLRKPVVYVPADIDVLVGRNCVGEAVSRLLERGFRIVVVEPYCVTMVRGGAVVDLYVYPTIGGVVYLDGGRLLGYRVFEVFEGLELPVLEGFAEAVLAIVHAVYKERIYTLNDYVTVVKWLDRRGLWLARELGVGEAIELVYAVNKDVEEGVLTLPYRLPLPLWAGILLVKILRDRVSRATLLNILKAIKSRRVGRLILSKIIRETY